MLYIISGIAMFMVHNTTVQAVAGAEGPTSGMMQHAPMHTICGMLGSAARRFINKQLPPEKSAPFTTYRQPIGDFQPNWLGRYVFFSWVAGVAIGMVFGL